MPSKIKWKSYKKFPGVRSYQSDIRKLPDGRKDECFYVRFKTKEGKIYQEKVGWRSEGITPQIAYERLLSLKRADKHGELFRQEMTLNEFWETKYFPWIKQHNRDWKGKLSRFRSALSPVFGKTLLSKITLEKAENYQIKRAQEVSPATVNREIALLRHMLSKAKNWNLIKENPLLGIKNLPEQNEDKWQYLENTQDLQKLVKAITPTYKHLVEFLALTGLRVGTALSLTWGRVDLEREVIFPPGEIMKGKKAQGLPMHPRVKEILAERLKMLGQDNNGIANQKIFPHSYSTFRKAFKKALKKAGLPENFRIHDLRHTYASWLISRGVPVAIAKELLAHKDIKMTMRYSHLSPDHLKEATKRLEDE